MSSHLGELRYFNGTGAEDDLCFHCIMGLVLDPLPKLYTHLAPRNAGFLKEFSKGGSWKDR